MYLHTVPRKTYLVSYTCTLNITFRDSLELVELVELISFWLLLIFPIVLILIVYRILLRKLHSYGIRDNMLKWFESYLTARSQYLV